MHGDLPRRPDLAALAAEIYRTLPRPRGREVDLAIVACALNWRATLWTLNATDFADIPGLRLFEP
jgi:predicted nucleic acid-binding protein